jgi:C4-dicarboxylate transporter/malic acid transport protein
MHLETMTTSIRPNWFASVMGTGIVANAAMLLPYRSGVLTAIAVAFWIAAAALLVTFVAAGALQFAKHRELFRSHHHALEMAPFYGAFSMGVLTVGSGALLAGSHILGTGPGVLIDSVLWTIGTLTGLVCAVGIPYMLFTEHQPSLEDAYGSWLMPIVPPMVSAAAAGALIPHLAAGQARLDLLYGSYAMFGISLVMAIIVIAILWARLALHDVGEARMTPTLWIVLGPLGQSVTAACLLAKFAPAAVDPSSARVLHDFALVYGIPIWGFAMAWLALSIAITAKTARDHLPFAPTWWSFTFPLGTVVTGTSQLVAVSGLDILRYIALVLYAGLVIAWVTVAARTLVPWAASVGSGQLRRSRRRGSTSAENWASARS